MFFPSLLRLFSICCSFGTMTKMVAMARNEPPEMLPLDGQRSRIRVPLGTKAFKLTCPVKTRGEHSGDGGEEEDEQRDGEELIIKWSKEAEPVSGDQFRLQNGDRDLRIRSPQLRDSGRYRCTAINEWGHRVVDFELEVFDPNATGEARKISQLNEGASLSVNVSAPKWTNQPSSAPAKDVLVAPGSSLHLQCPPSVGNPLPQVIWTRGGVPVSLEVFGPSSASFSIAEVQSQDSAKYSCLVHNQLGSIQQDFHVLVSPSVPSSEANSDEHTLFDASSSSGTFSSQNAIGMDSPLPPTPRIVYPSQNHQMNGTDYSATLRTGHTAQLMCRVEWRREKSVIRWLRMVDDVEALRARHPNATILRLGEMTLMVLDQDNEAVRVEMDSRGSNRVIVNELRIARVQKEDSGRYFCVVSNPAGQFSYRSALLRVVDPPPSLIARLLAFPHQLSPFFRFVLLLFTVLLSICVVPSLFWLCRRYHRRRLFVPNCSFCCVRCAQFSSASSTNNNRNKIKHSSVAGNTFASSSSSSGGGGSSMHQNHQKLLMPFGGASALLPPPPPRLPPPLLPPWPLHSTPLGRDGNGGGKARNGNTEAEPPHSLHRTERADDEMSRLSSHIYASGSPLPPPPPFAALCHPPLPFSPRPSLPIHHQQSAAQRAKLPQVRITAEVREQRMAEELRMPLMDEQRQSSELWHAN